MFFWFVLFFGLFCFFGLFVFLFCFFGLFCVLNYVLYVSLDFIWSKLFINKHVFINMLGWWVDDLREDEWLIWEQMQMFQHQACYCYQLNPIKITTIESMIMSRFDALSRTPNIDFRGKKMIICPSPENAPNPYIYIHIADAILIEGLEHFEFATPQKWHLQFDLLVRRKVMFKDFCMCCRLLSISTWRKIEI